MNSNKSSDNMGRQLLRNLLVALGLLSLFPSVYGMNNFNLLVPYNPLIRPYASADELVQFFVIGGGGIGNAQGFDAHNKTNVLRIFDCQQNALTMLEGFPAGSAQSSLLAQINPFGAGFDGKRGLFNVCGDLSLEGMGGLGLRYFWGDGWSINAYLPFYSMRLDNVQWFDQTARVTAADFRVHSLLTDNFAQNVQSLSSGLDIHGWHRAGIGDLAILAEWDKDFPQAKPVLKNVKIHTRAGFSAPTGLRRDNDEIMAMAFGNDGAWALPFALSLELTLGCYLQVGFDVQLMHVFGRTACERIPTAAGQTSLLFLQEACAFRDFGWNQQLSLYAGLVNLPDGFSARVGYQFIKQGHNAVSLCCNNLSTAIANETPMAGQSQTSLQQTGRSDLKDWTVHQIIVRTDYDCGIWLKDACVSPRFSFFAQLPFNGKRSALFTTFGASIGLDF
jgi:hypothetical protein